jgi:hypothetical protein
VEVDVEDLLVQNVSGHSWWFRRRRSSWKLRFLLIQAGTGNTPTVIHHHKVMQVECRFRILGK